MGTKLEIEITGSAGDGVFHWRAYGAKRPKGTVGLDVLGQEPKTGDRIRVELENTLDGPEIIAILKERERNTVKTAIQIKGSGTKSAPRNAGQPRNQVKGKQKQTSVPRGRSKPKETLSRPKETRSSRPTNYRMRYSNVHRNAFLDRLTEAEKPVGELLLKGGMPSVRAAIERQKKDHAEKGLPEFVDTPILTIADRLANDAKLALWRDRADSLIQGENPPLKELRATVASATSIQLEDQERLEKIKTLLDSLSTKLNSEWVKTLEEAIEKSDAIKCLETSINPPDTQFSLSSELQDKLAKTVSSFLEQVKDPGEFCDLIRKAAKAPYKRRIRISSLPEDDSGSVLATCRDVVSQIPSLAPLLGLKIPPPPKPLFSKN